MEETDRHAAGRLLKLVANGSLQPVEAEMLWPAPNTSDRSLSAAFHALSHYRADSKRLASDEVFAAQQSQDLERMAELLLQDADLDDATLDSLEPIPPKWVARCFGGDSD